MDEIERQAKRTFTANSFLRLTWVLIVVSTFVLGGSISYVTLGILLFVLVALYLIEAKNPGAPFEYKEKSNAKYPRPSTLLMILFVLTVGMNLPLFVPGFVKVEKDAFYAIYDDGSSGYSSDNINRCLNCPDPQYLPLSKDRQLFITGYSYDSSIGGIDKDIHTSMGPFQMTYVDGEYLGGGISLTPPMFLVKIFFAIQRIINGILFPLALF